MSSVLYRTHSFNIKRFLAILDSSGKIIVQYKYDAWGNHTVNGSNITLGNLNPFRYRSYYFDTETKLYFLQSRYYDPEVGRFLNMDSIDYADPKSINGLNLYAYCGKSSITRSSNNLVSSSYSPVINSFNSPAIIGTLYSPTLGSNKLEILRNYLTNLSLSFDISLANSNNNPNCPSWLYYKALYANGGINLGFLFGGSSSFAYLNGGVVSFGLISPKFFKELSQDSIFNPNVYLEIGACEVNASIGWGVSANASLLSAKVGLQLGDCIDFHVKGYVGYGLTYKFGDGFSLGGIVSGIPVGVEIGFDIDYIKLKEIFKGWFR